MPRRTLDQVQHELLKLQGKHHVAHERNLLRQEYEALYTKPEASARVVMESPHLRKIKQITEEEVLHRLMSGHAPVQVFSEALHCHNAGHDANCHCVCFAFFDCEICKRTVPNYFGGICPSTDTPMCNECYAVTTTAAHPSAAIIAVSQISRTHIYDSIARYPLDLARDATPHLHYHKREVR